MSVITKGKTFSNGEQLTAGKLNQMLDAASFSSAAVDNTKTTLSAGAITIAPDAITPTEVAQSFLDTIYPIGTIYTNATNSTNPGTLLGFGTWTAFGAGRVPVGIDSTDNDFDVVGEGQNTNGTNGEKTVRLTAAQSGLPSHTHTLLGGGFDGSLGAESGSNNSVNLGQTGATGGTDASESHTNLQPYIVVYMWKRTA